MISNDSLCKALIFEYRLNVTVRVYKPVGFMSAYSGPMPLFPFKADPRLSRQAPAKPPLGP